MSSWKYKIKISDLHEKYEEGVLDIKQLSEEVVLRFKTLSCYCEDTTLDFDHGFDYDLTEIVDEFDERIKSGRQITVEDYDDFLEAIYNWADRYKTCWIDTF